MNDLADALSLNEFKAWSEFESSRETFFKRGALLRVPVPANVTDTMLRTLVDAVSERHALLRTNYLAGEGAPVTLERFDHEIRVADACAYPVDGLYPDHLEPVDLVRIWLTPGQDNGRILYFDLNEMITDTGSTARLDADISAFLGGPYGPEPPANWAEPLAPTYRDFAVEQRFQPIPAEHIDHWTTSLAGLPPEGTIPDEGPDPSGDTAGERVWVLPDELTATFRHLCKRHRVSGFMTAVGLMSVAFGALWDLSDVAVATAASARPAAFRHVLGNFNNNVILRTPVKRTTSVSAAVDLARGIVLAALRHPIHHVRLLEMLGQAAPPPIRVHYLTVSDHYHKLLDDKPSGAEWVEPAEFPGWPLEVGFAEDSARRIAIWLQYDPRRFTHARVALILRALRELLQALAAERDPDVSWLANRLGTVSAQ